jgi:DNA-binding transcriptional LysR family regulator
MIVGTQTPMTSRILSEFGRRHPEARLELAEFDFADPSAGQRSQRVDVAFVMPPIDGPELRFLTLHEVPRVAVVPAGHRLAARASIAVAELFDDPWIVADTADEVCRAYWLAAEHRTAPPLIGAGTRTIDKFVQLVAAGQVVGLAASWVASVFARPDVVYLPVEDIAPARVALAWRADAANPLVPRLVDIARTLTDV